MNRYSQFYRCNILNILFLSWIWIPSTSLAEETLDFRFERMWPHLEQPWYFKNPTGIAISSDGQIYIADTNNHRVQVFDTEGRFVRSWGNEQFYPKGIAVSKSGLIYVTTANQIQVFNTTGRLLHTWGSEGTENGQFSEPRGLAISSIGLIFIADSKNNRVQVLDAAGRFVRAWGSSGADTGQLNNPQDIAISSIGQVYVLDSGNARVQVFTPQGQFLRTWGSEGSGNGQFSTFLNNGWLDGPSGITISNTGVVYVTDTFNNRIQSFNNQGGFLNTWGVYGVESGEFNGVTDLVIDNIGRLYVTDSWNNRIQIFNSNNVSAPLTTWQSYGSKDDEFNQPTGVALNNSGQIYIADQNNTRIKVFNATGGFVKSWGEYGTENGQMISPNSIAISSPGNVYVTDKSSHRISAFNSQGVFLFNIGEQGIGNGQFFYPTGIATDNTEQVYVVDTKNNRIQVFNNQGLFLRTWGSPGSGQGQFDTPLGITLSNGQVYVADSGNHRIQVFNNQGQFVRTWGSYGMQSGKFNTPKSVSIDNSGRVYVTDENGRVQIFTSTGIFISSLGKLGSNAGEFNGTFSIAINKSNNNLYVADTFNDRIQVFNLLTPTITNNKPPRALIIGGRTAANDALDNNVLSQIIMKAYSALRYQGYKVDGDDNEIRILWNGPVLSLPNGGILTTHQVTIADFATGTALTNWVQSGGRLLIYLVGHGIENVFYLDGVTHGAINAETFNNWLDQIQPSLTDDITIIHEACHSGSFIPILAKNKRVLLTSAAADKRALFANRGLNSYSYSLWSALEIGSNIKASHEKAVSDLEITQRGIPQIPQLDANGNGLSNEIGDSQAVSDICIGIGVDINTGQLIRTCVVSIARVPRIIRVTPPQAITNNRNTHSAFMNVVASDNYHQKVTPNINLWLEVSEEDAPSISSAWIIITRPDFVADTTQAFDNLPLIDLTPDLILGKEKWVGNYVAGGINSIGQTQLGFNVPGIYNLAYYVKNTDGFISSPIVESVTHYICGDADINGVINIIDALAIARHTAGLSTLSLMSILAADVDENGQISIADALLIAKRSVDLAITGTCWN